MKVVQLDENLPEKLLPELQALGHGLEFRLVSLTVTTPYWPVRLGSPVELELARLLAKCD